MSGSNDPLIGANEVGTSWFDLWLKSGATIRLCNLSALCPDQGLLGISAIRYLGSLGK
jgi:hypothetical protein